MRALIFPMISSSALLQLSLLLVVYLGLYTQVQGQGSAGTCSRPNSTYINSLRTLKNSTELLRVKTTDDTCFLWNITDYSEKLVSCAEYGSDEIGDWSDGDIDATNTSVSSISVTVELVTIEMNRNGEELTVTVNNTFYNDTIHTDWIHGFWTVGNLNTTFVLITNNNQTHEAAAMSIEFVSQSDNTSFVFVFVFVFSCLLEKRCMYTCGFLV